MRSTYLPIQGGLPTAPAGVSANRVRGWIREAVLREASATGLHADSIRDPLASDYWRGVQQAGNLRGDAAKIGARRLADSLGRQADASSTFTEALTSEWGAPIDVPTVPRRLKDGLPVHSVEPWADSYKIRFVDHDGTVQWGRGGSSSAPRADYGTAEQYRPMHLLWTATEMDAVQALHATSPNYGVAPLAEKAKAARYVMDRAIEDAIVNGVVGLDMWGLQQVPALRQTSGITYGTANAEDAFEDFVQFLQRVQEISLGVFEVNALAISQRIMNRLSAYITTGAGFPIDATAMLRNKLAEYGITRLIVAPSLRDFGGVNVDGAVLFNGNDNGLKRVQGLDVSPLRTVQEGLSDVTYYVCQHGGLYAPYAGSTFIYEIPISAL